MASTSPDIAVLVSSFERPQHLLRVLHSLAAQEGVEGRFEVVVTDDGSRDQTLRLADDFASRAPFRVKVSTHPHETFQLARCRNEGVRASSAPYLLFLDGDCMVPPDHLRIHLERAQRKVVQAGYCVLLDEQTTATLSVDDVLSGRFLELASDQELKKLAKMHRKARFYEWIGHPSKPKLFGGNVGIHREDYESVNGYDEAFEGWGCEDDDLRIRLRQAGVRVRSILGWTRTYHLWHPKGETSPANWRDGRNVDKIRRQQIATRCRRGLFPLDREAA